MKNFFSKTAFTLMELIISAALVTIVILGIVSINFVLSNNGQDYGQQYLVKSQTQTTLNHILNNAALAYSNATNDPAIVTAVSANHRTFCINQGPNNNIIGSPNEIWLCYQWHAGVNPTYPYQITWCAEHYALGGAKNCTQAISSGTILPAGTLKPTYLGTAYQNPTVTYTSAGQSLFSITILNCLDNSLASCNNTGVSSDPANNPEVELSGSTIPLQASST